MQSSAPALELVFSYNVEVLFLLESDSNATPRVSENCQLHYDYGSDPKTNENSMSGGGGMRSVQYPMKIGRRGRSLSWQ